MKIDLSGFELVDARERASFPIVTVRRSAQIGFNSAAVEQFGLERMQGAVIYYSPATQVLALEFVDDIKQRPEAASLRVTGEDTKAGTISAKSMFDKYGIDYSETRKHRAEIQEANNGKNVCVVDLKDPIPKRGAKKKGSSEMRENQPDRGGGSNEQET